MCVGFCPSFPDMFRRVDGYVDLNVGEIEAFVERDYESVNDNCFQCKLCYIKCPYTPDDRHDFALDFPRLMLRHKALRAKRDGISIQDRVLGEPQRLGRMAGGAVAPLSNFVNSNRLLRKVQEKTIGISADFNLPPFAVESFRDWFDSHQPAAGPRATGGSGDVVLFATCTTDFNMPSTGRAAVQVLEHNGFRVLFPKAQTCCGMPNLDGGDVHAAITKAKRNVAVLYPLVAAGASIVVPGSTCGYVLKKDLPELVPTEEARAVAQNTFDLMEFLRQSWRQKVLSRDFSQPLGRIAYHVPCHLRAQKIGAPGRILLSKVPDTEVEQVEECSAVDGTWGMKAQFYEAGVHYARKLIRGIRELEYDFVATDCPLSGQRLARELDAPAYHPVELLNRAYGLPEQGPASARPSEA